jgi:hypothetical protein
MCQVFKVDFSAKIGACHAGDKLSVNFFQIAKPDII